MASLITVHLNKGGSPNLGFRLQGGKDFGTPLLIQKVNVGSPAERAGLVAGDAVIKINNTDVYNLRHKDAQDVVVRAGPSFEISVQRGGSTWIPSVIPTGPLSAPSPYINSAGPVTRTSLAANKGENIGSIGTGHNLSAKPFSPQVNGSLNGGPKLVNKQYNTPLKLYSEESIAETLSAQTEVLSTGALGVNFKKNERNYDASNSEVLRALKEAENQPSYPDHVIRTDYYSTQSHAIGGRKSTTPNPVASEQYRSLNEQSRSVAVGSTQTQAEFPKPTPPEGATICTDCERVIVGVFVRIKDKNLHVECFKCSTCGSSLKNVGYYNINNKLYCDVHAKSAALKNQTNPNLVPITIPPGGRAPAHAISSALSSHSYPTSSPLSPKLNTAGTQYQAEETNENVDVTSSSSLLAKSNVIESNTSNNNLFSNSTPVSYSKYLNNKTNYSGPKPFSSVNAPLSPHNTLPRAAPLSPVAPAPSFNSHSYTPSAYSPSSDVQVAENIVWPPPQEEPEVPTACPLFYPPPSQIEQKILSKRKEKELETEEDCSEIEEINEMAQYSQNVFSEYSSRRKSTEECRETLTGTLDTQLLIENIVKNSVGPPSLNENILTKPQLEQEVLTEKLTCPLSLNESSCCQKRDHCELKRPTEYSPNTLERFTPTIDNAVPLKWESPLTQAIRTTSPDKDTFASIPTKHSHSALASALSVAPLDPFTPTGIHEEPVPLPEETVPYFPPERPVLPMDIEASNSDHAAPVPPIRKKFKNPNDKLLEDLPKPQERISLLAALTTAPDRPYSPFIEISSGQDKNQNVVEKQPRSDLHRPIKPDVLPESFTVHKKEPKPPSYYPPSLLYQRTEEAKSEEHTEESNITKTTTVQKETIQNPEVVQVVVEENPSTNQIIPPIFHGFSCSFQNKGDISQFSVDVRTTPPIISPPPIVPVVKTIESKQGYVQREIVTEERSEKQKTSKKTEQKEERTIQQAHQRNNIPVVKQAEEAIPVKPIPPVALRKPTQLPQYQVDISAEAESELIMYEKKRQAELRLEQEKQNKIQQNIVADNKAPVRVLPAQKPIIKIESEDNNSIFRPVVEENPPIHSFSPRPGTITPSNRGKSPAILPYYQVNLVPQHMAATHSNIFDPKSPAVSRSPSPFVGATKERSPSPVPGTASNIRAASPAPGPPENPLKSSKPLPNPESIRIDQARDSLTHYLPEYKSKMDLIELGQKSEFSGHSYGQNSQMYTSLVQTQNFPTVPVDQSNRQCFEMQKTDLLQAQRTEKNISQLGNTVVSTSIDEQMRQAHLEQLKQSQSHSVERSADGLTQIQRKKVVTEEFERSQKEVNIQIEKNVSSVKKHPFTEVNVPSLGEPSIKGHVTDPQRISVKKSEGAQKEVCQKLAGPLQAPPSATLQSSATASLGSTASASTPIKHVFAPSSIAPVKHVTPPSSSKKPNVPCVSQPDTGAGTGKQSAGVRIAPRRGRGILNPAAIGGARIPLCGSCNMQVRGPFITALGKIWCPNHFICSTPSCRRPLQDIGFVEERGQLYCEYCFEQYLAPPCSKCGGKIKGDCLKAIGKNFHPECFNCTYCGKLFGNSPFFLEDGSPYCDADWNELFTTKCYACAFPIEAGDRWVEALNNNYHSQCFNCTMCKKNLEGQSFFAKGGRPFCKNHAR
ncbi:PDZ and LIM domain protein Zasp isoform X1 [Diabrotica undecimpunctata]|uniref:PDZ and LIM domain protein Zasp isoform X1 n=1 Tax=Diabrotica undecimpunctata TaxID=50387 RepID=UPI003B632673